MEDKQYCVFGYFVDGEFKGWRADSFGTLDILQPKIYTYTPSQVDIIKKNTSQELSNSGTSFMKALFAMGGAPMNAEGQLLDKSSIIGHVSQYEQEKRDWGSFELRVYPIPFYYDEYEEWKMEAFNANLPEPLEIHKFEKVKNEN